MPLLAALEDLYVAINKIRASYCMHTTTYGGPGLTLNKLQRNGPIKQKPKVIVLNSKESCRREAHSNLRDFVCLFAWGLTAHSAQIGNIAP